MGVFKSLYQNEKKVGVAKWDGPCGLACGPLQKMRGEFLISTR